MTSEKVHEDRLRRMAKRQGLTLRKSRTRDRRALSYGAYWLVDLRSGYIVAGDPTYGGFSLNGIEDYLTGRDRP